MRREDIRELYDQEYAELYNERFLLGEAYNQTTEYEISLLQELLRHAESWLDVACGTGYILSQFPRVRRAGLDLSPAMIEVARRENPDVNFVLGDFLDNRPEWHGRWDLVSCMWQAYTYVDTTHDVFRLVENLAAWTAEGGSCFLPICDMEVLCGHEIPFSRWLDTLDGTLQIDAVVWSCLEPSGRKHVNLIAPHRDLFVREFEKYFCEVTLLNYPHTNRDAVGSRPRAVIAKGRSSEPCHVSQHEARKPVGLQDVR
jgi:SAM-dependent methyltransferase